MAKKTALPNAPPKVVVNKQAQSWTKNDTRILIAKLTKLEETEEKNLEFSIGYSFRFMNTRLRSDRVNNHRKLLEAISLITQTIS